MINGVQGYKLFVDKVPLKSILLRHRFLTYIKIGLTRRGMAPSIFMYAAVLMSVQIKGKGVSLHRFFTHAQICCQKRTDSNIHVPFSGLGQMAHL
jgi:hypothetical protein